MPPKVVPKSNVTLLTEGQSYIKRAKRDRQDQVEAVKFDDEARREWLTGFSKRKKARVEGRRERAKERDKQAHLEEVKKARRELKERALQNVKDVRRAMGLPDLPEPGAAEETEAVAEPEQDEYEDEETQATVTIQEDFDPSSAPTPSLQTDQDPSASSSSAAVPTLPPIFELPASSRKQQLKAVREKDKSKSKKKKDATGSFETKSERKKGRALETLRRNEKGALARERTGGGGSRGRGGSRGGRGGGRGGGGSRGRGGGRGGKK